MVKEMKVGWGSVIVLERVQSRGFFERCKLQLDCLWTMLCVVCVRIGRLNSKKGKKESDVQIIRWIKDMFSDYGIRWDLIFRNELGNLQS